MLPTEHLDWLAVRGPRRVVVVMVGEVHWGPQALEQERLYLCNFPLMHYLWLNLDAGTSNEVTTIRVGKAALTQPLEGKLAAVGVLDVA